MAGDATPTGLQDLRRVVALAVVVLAACLAFAASWGQDRAGTVSTDEPPSDVLLTYVRQGGIAGGEVRLTVTADGDAKVYSSGVGNWTSWTRRLPDDRFAALRTALERSGFHDLEADYRRNGVCNDCFVETVTYGGRSVVVQASAVPAGLADVLRLLGELVSDA